MPPPKKEFVKYAFDDPPVKPRETTTKERPPNNHKTKRNVSYQEKSSLRQNVLKEMIDSYIPMKKPSKEVMAVCNQFPKYFNAIPKQPQAFSPQNLDQHLIFISKRTNFEPKNKKQVQREKESSQQPDWDSQSDTEGGIQSKQIDNELLDKLNQKYANYKQIRNSQLKRHEKQFLQDYIKQKKHEQDEKLAIQTQIQQKAMQQLGINLQKNDWTQYQEKQVNDFIDMGFIEKIDGNQDFQNIDFGDEDFSVEDQKSKKSSSSSESSEEDDIFGDQGPRAIIKKQQAKQNEEVQANKENLGQKQGHGTLVISSHVFSKIAQQIGIPPSACIWIISNKTQRYKVSTQYMDQIYRQNGLSQLLPYISLNHSEFVHNNEVQQESGLKVLRNYNARRYQEHKKYKNYQGNSKPVRYQPHPTKNKNTHLNKK